jgi:hypothetical protein
MAGLAPVLKAGRPGHFHRRKQERDRGRARGGRWGPLRYARSEVNADKGARLHRNRQALVLAECQEPTT